MEQNGWSMHVDEEDEKVTIKDARGMYGGLGEYIGTTTPKETDGQRYFKDSGHLSNPHRRSTEVLGAMSNDQEMEDL